MANPTPDRPALLGRWYADPLTPAQADALLQAAEQRRRRGLGLRRCRTCLLQELVARHWRGEEIGELVQRMRRLLRGSAHGRILLELIYGQLLMAQRRATATAQLEEAFRIAQPLLTAADYLRLLRRHRQLANLPLDTAPQAALPLEQLLVTAQVIERLERGNPHRPQRPHDPADTYG